MTDRDTITLPREVVKLALEALEWSWGGEPMGTKEREAITALRTALAAEPTKPEPVVWWDVNKPLDYLTRCENGTTFHNRVIMPRHAVAWAYTNSPEDAEQPKQEPVAWMDRFGSVVLGKGPYETFTTPLYTFPPDAPTVKESLTHPGYIIGSHWLETAYSRVCAGEAEADVLRDIGLVRITDGMVETADIHAIVDRQEALRRDAERWRHWRDSHGFAMIDHEKGRCFVTLICDCDDPDQVRAKRFRGEDSFEWLDAFTDAAMEDKT